MSKTPAQAPVIAFSRSATPKKGTVIIFAAEGETFVAKDQLPISDEIVKKACEVAEFTGKFAETVEILAPAGSDLDRLAVVGTGKLAELDNDRWVKLGGAVYAAAGSASEVEVLADLPEADGGRIADLGLGMLLRAHTFDKYKTKKSEKDASKKDVKAKAITIQCADPKAAEKAFARSEAIAGGVILARDLVNEPANVLGPVEFAAKASALKKLGVKVDILTEREMADLKMNALLGVGQGSSRPPRLAVMQWNGGKSKEKPIAFIGKGVVFDTGGISIKPAGGMEDMKGDMAGAAAVIGVMQALAARKAKANVVGIIGLVENMPDGNAQRPGDIVTSMSGQTIEIINTDAEGRLVLADALWYCKENFEPQFMVNLATLTGAILVALGTTHAGLFSNDDTVADRLTAAGLATGEKLWRMPLGADYDKMIDSKFADMKNTGGRYAGSITAAQFLKRFVGETPWAHLDVAGTAMDSPASEISRGWASGFGVRLLDRLVADHFEG